MIFAALLNGAPAAAAPAAAGDDPMVKVDKAVLELIDAKDEATFNVILRDRAVLTGAASIAQRAQRTTFVYEQLTQTAQRSQAGLRALLDARNASYRAFWIVNTIQVTGGRDLLKEIASRDEVDRIIPQRTYKLVAPKPGKAEAQVDAGVNTVEWNIDRVRAPQVWSTFGNKGEGIVVANIDTGVEFTHPAVVAKYRGNLGGGQFDHNYNFFDPANVCPGDVPCDNNGHGTHTMGTMVGDDGDPGTNQIGVAPHARWIAAKGCESNGCSDNSLLASGEWVMAPTDLNGQNARPDLAPHIVNNSWGGPGGDTFFQEIVSNWVQAGIFPAFSAGNDGPACGSAGSPGDQPNSYAAGMFNINNVIDPDSGRGPSDFGGEIKPNIAAPGTNVRSSVPGGGYAAFTGTSMASPHVAATVALMWSAAPSLHGDVAATRQILDDTAVDTADAQCGGTVDDNNVWGEGKLDAFAAVQASPRGASGTLRGTVTDAASGAPVGGAAVRLTGADDRSTTTAPDGTWQVTLATGTYNVAISKFGFATHTTPGVEVLDGQTTTLDVALTAAPSHTVSGTVRDDLGGIVAGATVTVLGTPIPPVTANASGVYSIPNVPEGEYDLQATGGRCFGVQRQHLVVDGPETLDFLLPSRTDQFGHVCRPSQFDFISAGTIVPLTGDDAAAQISLPFPFTYYGQTHTSAFVSTNGNLNFLAASTVVGNVAIPNASTPNAAIYPLWDDLVVDANASVRTQVVGTAPERKFVIEWRNAHFFQLPGDRVTFEIVLWETGRVQFQYATVPASARGQGNSATIGIENHAGNDALQYSFNEAVLSPNSSITFRKPNQAFVRGTVTDANDGLPVAGATVRALRDGNQVAQTTADANGAYRLILPLGTYAIEGSAPGYGTVSAPAVLDQEEETVTVNLALPTGRAEVSPDSIEVVVPSGERRTRGFTLRNTGGATLVWQLEERAGGTPQDVPWLAASPTSGSLASGGTQAIGVLVDATGLAPGVYDASVVVVANSGRGLETPVAVRLIVPAYQAGINAGGLRHVDGSGDTWQDDRAHSTGSFGYIDNRKSIRNTTSRDIAGTTEDTLYRSQRENAFEYRFDNVPNGVYEIDLRFAELRQQQPNKRLFDVIAENQVLLPAHDVALEVGSFAADDHTFSVRVTDGTLNVRLIARAGSGKPIINAVRATHRPDRS